MKHIVVCLEQNSKLKINILVGAWMHGQKKKAKTVHFNAKSRDYVYLVIVETLFYPI